MIDLGRFKGATVLVTGASGFKGMHLAAALRSLGANVVGFSLPRDIRSKSTVQGTVEATQPDFVFHLAAQAFVPRGFTDPVWTFETNTLGTVNLLEALRSLKKPCAVVVVTTDKVYGGPLDGCPTCGHVEEDPLIGCCPYAASKVGAEHAVAAYRTIFAKEGLITVATARAGNVIGGGDWGEGRLVPNAIRALRAKKPITVWHADAVRPWQYVEDVVRGYLMLGAALKAEPSFEGAWNFGPTNHYTVLEVVEHLIAAWGEGTWEAAPKTFHEVSELRIDSTKARQRLGWEPLWALNDMIEATVKAYRGAHARV